MATSSIEKDKAAIRLQMKQFARIALELRIQGINVKNNIDALGVTYNDPSEAEESNGLYAIGQLLDLLVIHSTNLTKAADIGNNLG